MASKELTFKMKNEILRANNETFLERIDVGTMSMAQLVSANVITTHQSEDIQDVRVTGTMRQSLFNLLLSEPVEAFINFCIVLCDKRNNSDIVRDDFGLNITDLKLQKVQIERKKTGSSVQQERPAIQNGAQFSTNGDRLAHPVWDEKNEDGQTKLKNADLYKNVKDKYDEFVEDIRLDNLWPKFKRLNVLNKANEARVKNAGISQDKVYKLMEILESSPIWRFHAFLKALCEDDQGICVTLLGLDTSSYSQ